MRMLQKTHSLGKGTWPASPLSIAAPQEWDKWTAALSGRPEMEGFEIGDDVRIIGLPNSQWQGERGKVTEVMDRAGDGGDNICECRVNIAGVECWFRADHLVKSVPSKWVRFFRAEAQDRWQLHDDDAAILNGDHTQLVAILQERHAFSGRRAKAEADKFFSMLYERIGRATTIPDRTSRSSTAVLDF
jgi:hypothetical protein